MRPIPNIPFSGASRPQACIAALRDARARIACGLEVYLCHALHEVALDYNHQAPETLVAADEVRAWVENALSVAGVHKFECVETWLELHGAAPEHLARPDLMREYRIRWCNHMIVYFGGKP